MNDSLRLLETRGERRLNPLRSPAMVPLVLVAVLAIMPVSQLTALPPGPPKPVAALEGVAKPPAWAVRGALVYRVSTPDEADLLPVLEEGHAILANLLDKTVSQVTIVNGLVGHDHRGPWNWDGLWPYWNRTTFRAGTFGKLAGFMSRAREKSNVRTGFHLNLTDVNAGLKDYPESRDFFARLVETGSIYRRDWNPKMNRREGDPFIPGSIEKYLSGKNDSDPVRIIALVNYKKFWESGLAGRMIDDFYGRLPFPPPMLYLDVLNASGGNFATGFPDGPLGGSEQTQIEGMREIADYLHGKGTDLGTEGNRPFLGDNRQGFPRAGYVWLHGQGFSSDDYRVISGGAPFRLASQHVYGNPGAFNISPIAVTRAGLDKVRAHHGALLAGKPGNRAVAGKKTWHIAVRDNSVKDEYDIPGTGDPFRGDWADLANNFYMTTIQELHHIGNRALRKRMDSIGHVHLGAYTLSGPGGTLKVSVPDHAEPEWARQAARRIGRVMIENPLTTTVRVPRAGKYSLKVACHLGGRSDNPQIGVYVNGRHHRSFEHLPIGQGGLELDAGEVDLIEGENTVGFDSGMIRASWSDGTMAEWKTPMLRKGLRIWKDDTVYAEDFDRMWPDTWSGQKKIYFFSWEGCRRAWKLPPEWRNGSSAVLYPLTPDGRGKPTVLPIADGAVTPVLSPQVPAILVPSNP
ncbi:MAG: hypothetical protein ACKO9Z_05430 [Planctomycetota bacterium]